MLKKIIATTCMSLLIAGTFIGVNCDASTSKAGYYYNGRGWVSYSASLSTIYARADELSSGVNAVESFGKTNSYTVGYDYGVTWAETYVNVSPNYTNHSYTASRDASGYKSICHY